MGQEQAATGARYSVLGLLGQGGMSVVYRATDRAGGPPLALKRLLSELRDKRVELFHQEYRTLAQLAHPNVVQVHDFGVDAEGPYYTMELLDGADLHAIAPLPWRQACALIRDVCSAVALLHSRRLLHRDLSPKNIKRTAAGHAKLMDFGAMAPMGPQKMVIGTPPCIPPEAVLREPLDARSDLYALGATLYFALTGRHAYPAKQVGDLHTLWRATPNAPSTLTPEVPPELDKLVLSLLSIDGAARPRSAAEVFDRLNAIAGLTADEHLSVRNAYLSTPELVARSSELAAIRGRLSGLREGRGGVFIVAGDEGMGRSRMLDTLVLEAKLAGLLAARATAQGAQPYAAVTQLLERLIEVLPGLRDDLSADLSLLDALLAGAVDSELDQARRAEIGDLIATAVRLASIERPLVLAVDDFERCDDASQAALTFVSKACASDRVLLALVTEHDANPRSTGALAVLRERATVLTLRPLHATEIEQLLGSVFGEVPNLASFALQLTARAEGRPRDCLQLAQYAVDRSTVRYDLGRWVLPAGAIDDALPSSLSRVLRAKLDALPADALALAEALALALAHRAALPLSAYPELTSHGDELRVHVALNALLLAQVMTLDHSQCAFVSAAWIDELLRALPEAREREHCARIAEALARRTRDRLEVAVLRYRAGQTALAIDAIIAELSERGTRWQSGPRRYAQVLQGCIAACEPLGRPRRERYLLRRELVSVGADLTVADMPAHYAALFRELRKDACLDDWDALGGELSDLERLQKAFERTQQRFDAAGDAERGLPPFEAIRAITRLVSEATAYASQVSDYELFSAIPSLAPLCVISPAIDRVWNLSTPACRAVVAGRYGEALTLYRRALDGVRTPESSGLDETMRLWSWYALHYAIGSIEAGYGSKRALECAAELERDSSWAITATCVRAAYYGTIGNGREAERWRKALELARVQSPVKPVLAIGAAHQYVYVASLADDLPALRHLAHELEVVAVLHPPLRSYAAYARAESTRVTGNHEETLRMLDELLAGMPPGTRPLWPWAVGTRLNALVELARYDEAKVAGREALAIAEHIQLDILKDRIIIPLALAEARLGDTRQACSRLDEVIGWRAHDADGAAFGWCLEARARAALWMGDGPAFQRYAALCGQQYRLGGEAPALMAKHERLLQEGRQRGMIPVGAAAYATVQNDTAAGPTLALSRASTMDDETRIETGPPCAPAADERGKPTL